MENAVLLRSRCLVMLATCSPVGPLSAPFRRFSAIADCSLASLYASVYGIYLVVRVEPSLEETHNEEVRAARIYTWGS